MKSETSGKQYWSSLEQRAQTPEFQELVHREFPEGASELSNPVSRRKFLSLMGASMALAGLTSCRRPVEKIVPYVTRPEEIVPGTPQYFATSMPFGHEAFGILVESHEGRPTKIEGNEQDAVTAGKSDAWMQAEILNLYDPDRSQVVRERGQVSSWARFEKVWASELDAHDKDGGAHLGLLLEPSASPSQRRLLESFHQRFPNAAVAVYAPVNDESVSTAVEAMTGTTGLPRYDLDQARVILSLDSDFLGLESDHLRMARGFAQGRRVTSEQDEMNRLYVAETALSLTGGMADHRIRVRHSDMQAFALALAQEFEHQGVSLGLGGLLNPVPLQSFDKRWIRAVVEDLRSHTGESLVLAGRHQPSQVHLLISAINRALGNEGQTVKYLANPDQRLSDTRSLIRLSENIRTGKVNSLVIIGGNPVYSAPAELQFADLLGHLSFSAYLSAGRDETSRVVDWSLPRSHFLEAWDDVSTPGQRGVVQPLIAPLYESRSDLELLGLLVNGTGESGYDLVRETWQDDLSDQDFEKAWRRVLHAGVHSMETSRVLSSQVSRIRTGLTAEPLELERSPGIEVSFRTSFTTFDGRYANNGWMQELPDPITKITWDNAALMSKATAEKLGVRNEDLVRIEGKYGFTIVPVWIQPGLAEDSIALELGYGREHVGRIGRGIGGNVYAMRGSDTPHFFKDARITRVGGEYRVACVQDNHGMDEEALAAKAIQQRLPGIIREASLDEYRDEPDFAKGFAEEEELRSMWKDFEYDTTPQWGMSIDLNSCIGCAACTIACQSENNIPVIGKGEVLHGREMHWLRMDRYYTGDVDEPEMVVQPVGCQQCEMAPCEQVCPVGATNHSDEGLNQMVYNRCIGTRYCSNNCPYKVRRFNFFNYAKDLPEIVQMARNPDVTVRFRGVMEKCTYCVQRIEVGRIDAKNKGRNLQDGDIVSACQQSCPTDAIVFGDITDPDSQVSRLKEQNRDYALLGELNTRPRTTYLAKLRNPNPALLQEA